MNLLPLLLSDRWMEVVLWLLQISGTHIFVEVGSGMPPMTMDHSGKWKKNSSAHAYSGHLHDVIRDNFNLASGPLSTFCLPLAGFADAIVLLRFIVSCNLRNSLRWSQLTPASMD